jgi:hypothetical protein
MEHGDECEHDDDVHEVTIGIEYELVEGDEEGTVDARAAAIHSHVHNVPPEIAAQTLVIVAHKMLSDYMAHTTFESVPNHEIAHAMAHAAAAVLLIESIKSMPPENMISTIIPDDISELLGE